MPPPCCALRHPSPSNPLLFFFPFCFSYIFLFFIFRRYRNVLYHFLFFTCVSIILEHSRGNVIIKHLSILINHILLLDCIVKNNELYMDISLWIIHGYIFNLDHPYVVRPVLGHFRGRLGLFSGSIPGGVKNNAWPAEATSHEQWLVIRW